MRLSDAILLGSTFIEAVPGSVGSYGASGCAAGMAVAATGDSHNRISEFCIRWPWAVTQALIPLPCSCDWMATTLAAIIHLFDEHWDSPHERWTIEQLADWVRSVEPPENAEQLEVNACEVIQVNG